MSFQSCETGLRTLLDADPDIEVVDDADSGIHALMLVRTLKLDVAVVVTALLRVWL
jgi:DNA-binding NarL/FixJ family response regulator